jgi:Leucine-rich repeat (LRR) protein
VLNMGALEELNLNNNKLKDVNNLAKSHLPSLKILLFKNNKLQTLPRF